jgi:hypothetical protein
MTSQYTYLAALPALSALAAPPFSEKTCGCGPDCRCGSNCACGPNGKCDPACTCAE